MSVNDSKEKKIKEREKNRDRDSHTRPEKPRNNARPCFYKIKLKQSAKIESVMKEKKKKQQTQTWSRVCLRIYLHAQERGVRMCVGVRGCNKVLSKNFK